MRITGRCLPTSTPCAATTAGSTPCSNPTHRANAIGIRAVGARAIAGYVNKGMARSLAKKIDAGDYLSTVVLRGSPPGRLPGHTTVIVAAPSILAHLARHRWPREVASPR